MQQKRVVALGGGREMEGAAALLLGSGNREGRRTKTEVGWNRCLEGLRNRNLMCIQWPRFTGSPVIRPLSKPSMCVVKRIRFDEPYAATV